jgi:hypothetical protein
VNANPLLAPLADNGGPTQTMALLAVSPALDAGNNCPPTDQRGLPRPQGPGCDIGAFELEVLRPSPSSDGDRRAAKLKFLAGQVRVDPKKGKGRLRVSCLAAAGDRCTVNLRLRFRGAKAGWVKGRVAGQKSGWLRVKVKRASVLLLAEAGGKPRAMKLKGTSRNRAGAAVAVNRSLKVKLRAPKRR